MSSSVCDIQLGNGSNGTAPSAPAAHSHDHADADAGHSHSHDGEAAHGHSHPIMEHAGKFGERDLPDFSKRNWKERCFTVGLGGPVGSGKTALLLALCRKLTAMKIELCAVTNDIVRGRL